MSKIEIFSSFFFLEKQNEFLSHFVGCVSLVQFHTGFVLKIEREEKEKSKKSKSDDVREIH